MSAGTAEGNALSRLIAPYGGPLVDLIAAADEQADLKNEAAQLPSIQLSDRSVCDLELLAVGAFSPLDRFMGARDHERVLAEMRLADGHLFPVPVSLPVERRTDLALDRDIALRNGKNELLAVMTVDEIYEWDRDEVARAVLGTRDVRHPLLAEMSHWGELQVSGPLRVLQLPRWFDFPELRVTPAQVRERFDALRSERVLAFQTLAPLHPAHDALIARALSETQADLLLHPIVSASRSGDAARHERVRSYLALRQRVPEPTRTVLALLPLATRRAGPREALWQALIRRNYGASAMVVAQDHASPGLDSSGRPFYAPGAAQDLVEEHRPELQVSVVRADQMRAAAPGIRLFGLAPESDTRGFCVWFTGLSGSGKSTTAEVLTVLLLDSGREVTLLDGDVVRTHLSKGLGFSREDRDVNIRRIGFVAAEIVRHGGFAVCAAVSPYRSTRSEVRDMVGSDRFVEVFVDTPLEVCEERDVKGMYAMARQGGIAGFTGVDDPYEPPRHPELTLQTVGTTPQENARRVFDYLVQRGLVEPTPNRMEATAVGQPGG